MNNKTPKYIFVVGGVMSGVGKGVTASSIGTLLQGCGYKVTAVKIDPYINVDAGTMNPTRHGEVFVLDDGDETDQDMGNYERFLNISLTRTNYMTTGRVYQEVIRKERNLEYEGRDVEVIPDIPDEVLRRIKKATIDADADIAVIEIGGTIGEYQNLIFLEAARMMKSQKPTDVMFVMVSYLPTPPSIGEMKTKPTQYASRTLNGVGIQADVIIARAETELDNVRKEKIAKFCNINTEQVISAPNLNSIYDLPINMANDNLDQLITNKLGLNNNVSDLTKWRDFVTNSKEVEKSIKIAVVGKYFSSGDFVLSDVYISVLEAIKFSSFKNNVKPDIKYFNSEYFANKENIRKLSDCDGVLVPGGFGSRGIEGKINVIEYCRLNKIPYFGLCYGMQLMCVEYARNVLKLNNANTIEIDPNTNNPIVVLMDDQNEIISKSQLGGTMRLGSYPCQIQTDTVAHNAYKQDLVNERHRHRYEVNPKYVQQLTDGGLVFSGKSPNNKLMEIAELPQSTHPFFLATQFHPEFLARPLNPHPLFNAFIKACIK